MVRSNLLVLSKPRVAQYLTVAMLMVFSLGAFGFPFPSIPSAYAAPTPEINGPLVRTDPFVFDIECQSQSSDNCNIGSTASTYGNYRRLVMYSWGVDPLNGDPNY